MKQTANNMNIVKIPKFVAVVLLATMHLTIFSGKLCQAQTGGTYDLTWSTIDGGGGRSTGGVYTLEGTIGQPDAGLMSGGNYVLAGGFWPATTWCIVDLPDLATFLFLSFWLNGSGAPEGDFDNNGKCDLYDFNHLATYWLRLCPDTWPWW